MNKIVYSTDPDWQNKCKECGENSENCICTQKTDPAGSQRMVYIQREKKGRKGKTVTLVSNLWGDLKKWQKELQTHCGAGGTTKQDTIEIQGDQRLKIQKFLQQRGIQVKLKGG